MFDDLPMLLESLPAGASIVVHARICTLVVPGEPLVMVTAGLMDEDGVVGLSIRTERTWLQCSLLLGVPRVDIHVQEWSPPLDSSAVLAAVLLVVDVGGLQDLDHHLRPLGDDAVRHTLLHEPPRLAFSLEHPAKLFLGPAVLRHPPPEVAEANKVVPVDTFLGNLVCHSVGEVLEPVHIKAPAIHLLFVQIGVIVLVIVCNDLPLVLGRQIGLEEQAELVSCDDTFLLLTRLRLSYRPWLDLEVVGDLISDHLVGQVPISIPSNRTKPLIN